MHQARVVRGWRPHPAWPHRAALAALIRKTLDRKTEDKAFAHLEALGPSAVPAMVDLMDDRRPLGVPWISLPQDDPNFWEGRYVEKPELVVDAIAAILSNMTDEGFGYIDNGGSEEQRAMAVSGWRVYVHDRWADGRFHVSERNAEPLLSGSGTRWKGDRRMWGSLSIAEKREVLDARRSEVEKPPLTEGKASLGTERSRIGLVDVSDTPF